ncbi:hypothetical protein F3087_16085 [Nocardia colli]|uniref:Uncharacterized protein n=1 Tax=Nocardia colli TaxID=2545717 RepID=A0A5N0EI69_9NOCA|nr:hypothetical protein [Nocardia colli]KAA8888520.1 hypothetical protein F3087_16085 [Nocardia colli]
MASREITVRLAKADWRIVSDAADCAGMSIEAYISWGVRLLALQAVPGAASPGPGFARPEQSRRAKTPVEQPESAVWEQCFAERLSHHAEQFREV